jgi:hypothetical protein
MTLSRGDGNDERSLAASVARIYVGASLQKLTHNFLVAGEYRLSK